MIKQDIYIYVAYSRPNGWTDWAEFFGGHSWVAGGRVKTQNEDTNRCRHPVYTISVNLYRTFVKTKKIGRIHI